MADSGYYSINDFLGDSWQTTFEVSFAGGYISKSHIYARLINNTTKAFSEVPFTWVNDFTINVAAPIPLGYTLRLYRATPIDKPLVDYSDGALLSEVSLDTANKQAIFAAAEASDAFGTVPGNDALRDATAALAFARGRENHTGSQAIATIAGLATALADKANLSSLLATGAALIGYNNHTVEYALKSTIRLTDYILSTDADAGPGFIRFVAALNDADSPYVYGEIASGNYNIDAAFLAVAPKITRNDVTIRGLGKPTIQVTGSGIISAILNFENVSGRVEGIRFRGNSQGSGYVNGSAIWFSVTPAAVQNVGYVEVVDNIFDNFRSPYWIYTDVTSNSYGVSAVVYKSNRVVTRSGNEILPGSQGMISAAFVAKSKISPTNGGGGVRNVVISDNVIEATYIKTGIFLADNVKVAKISNNIVTNAGLVGASDAAGAYAYAAYDSDQVGMANITFDNNEVNGVRSVGIYAAGVAGITITNFVGRGQTDVNDSALPKGMLVFNGCSSVTLDGARITDCLSDAIYFIPSSLAGQTVASMRNIFVSSCRSGMFAKSAYKPSVLEIDGLTAVDVNNGIIVALDDSGTTKNWNFTRLNISSARASSFGVRLYSEETGSGIDSISIGGSSNIAVAYCGIGINGLQFGSKTIKGIKFNGSHSLAAIYADGTYGFNMDELTFSGQQAPGSCFRTSGARGSIGMGISMQNVAAGAILAASGSDLGLATPTHAAVRGTVVKALLPSAASAVAWLNTDGGTTWKPFNLTA